MLKNILIFSVVITLSSFVNPISAAELPRPSCPPGYKEEPPGPGDDVPESVVYCVPDDPIANTVFPTFNVVLVGGGFNSSNDTGGIDGAADGGGYVGDGDAGETSTSYSQDGENAGEPKCSDGNPIDLVIQNKYQHEVDFKGFGELPISIERSYNSISNVTGLFGAKWASNLSKKLSWSITENNGEQLATIAILFGDGRRATYSMIESENIWRHSSGKAVSIWVDINDNWVLAENGVTYTFSQNGNIIKEAIGDREYKTYIYGLGNVLNQVVHSTGASLSFSYNSKGFVSSITTNSGLVYSYTYTSNDVISSVTYPNGSGTTSNRQYIYSSNTNLAGIIDENNNRYASWTYGSNSKANKSYHGNNQEVMEIISSQRTGTTHTTRTRNALGKETTYTFNKYNDEWNIVDVQGHAASSCLAASKSYTYDSNGQLDLETSWDNAITDYDYDDLGLLYKKVEAVGSINQRITEFVWHSILNKPTLIKTDSSEKRFTYRSDGLIEAIEEISLQNASDIRAIQFSYTFHSNGLVKTKSVDGFRTDVNDTTIFEYSTSGFLIKTTNAIGHVTTYSGHNIYGKPALITRPDNSVSRFTYHPRGWLLKTEHDLYGDKRTTSYSYDKVGQLIQLTQADGSVLSLSYDTSHRLSSVTNSNNESKQYLYDAASNVTSESMRHWVTVWETCPDEPGAPPSNDPFGGGFGGDERLCPVTINEDVKTEKRTYDALSRLKTIIHGYGTDSSEFFPSTTQSQVVASVDYDLSNRPVTNTDGNSNSTQTEYDVLGRVKKSTDPMQGTTEFWYDSNDRVTQVKDPKGIFTYYTYDTFGNVTRLNSADTGITDFQYNLAGNLTRKTDANGIVSTYQYDALGRLTQANLGSMSQTYTYDSQRKGYLYRLVDSSGTQTFTYNAHGEMTQRVSNVNGINFTTHWQFNKVGKVKAITYPNGVTATSFFDAIGNTSRIQVSGGGVSSQDLVKDIQYKPFGPIDFLRYGSGIVRLYNRDNRYRLLSIYSYNIASLNYSYDGNSNITKITDSLSSTPIKTKTYSYDDNNRVINSNEFGTPTSYNFDENGNRLSMNGTNYNIAGGSNRLNSYSNQVYNYDANGNVTRKGSYYYTYNDENRLSRHQNGSTITDYKYNALGQRLEKSTNGSKTYFQYDLDGKLIYERKGSTHKTYIYLNNEIVGYTKNNVLYYVHSDHLSRPAVVTQTNGTKVWQARNEAYGRVVTSNTIGSGGMRLGFPGQYWDDEKQSWYNYFRDYDSTTGRYLQSDPIGLVGGINTYTYALNNSIKYYDPNGLSVFALIGCGGGLNAAVGTMNEVQAQLMQLVLDGVLVKKGTSSSGCDEDLTPGQEKGKIITQMSRDSSSIASVVDNILADKLELTATGAAIIFDTRAAAACSLMWLSYMTSTIIMDFNDYELRN